MKRVLVTRALPSDILASLTEAHVTEIWEEDAPISRQSLHEMAAGVHGILSMLTDPMDQHLLDAASNLEVISQMAVGVDNIDLVACVRRGVRVGHTAGVLTETVADTAMALIGSIVRRIPEASAAVIASEWGPWSPFWMAGGDLHGAVLGIVGMGRVGQAVARRGLGFDMEIVYTNPSPVPEAPGRSLPLSELLAVAHIVLLAAPLNTETRGMIGREQLSLMRPDAYLVNVARGLLVVTDALVEALSQGQIAGAALDVTDPEPLPSDHPLVAMSNCLITPHIASASVKTRRRMASLAVENLMAGLAGEPMPAEVVIGG